MKKLLLIALLTSIGVANAGDYTESNNLARLCKARGAVAIDTFDSKQDGKSLEDILAYPQSQNNEMAIRVVVKTYNGNYPDRKEAFMAEWARCMDEYQ